MSLTNTRKFKVQFDKLIGKHYSTEEKMFVLNWMLSTGSPYSKYIGRWNKTGVNQTLFAYSANDHSSENSIPNKMWHWDMYYDAIFARAVYLKTNSVIDDWRNSENILSNKYRMLNINDNVPSDLYEKHKHLSWLVNNLFEFEGKMLKKEKHHEDFTDRINPKIIYLKIFTYGKGWMVKYGFSFEKFNYENGWQHHFIQKENQSLWEFFGEVYNEIENRLLAEIIKKLKFN